MASQLELRKYHLIEQLLSLSDIEVIKSIENTISNFKNNEDQVLQQRANIAEEQLNNKQFKIHAEAKVRLEKWAK